MFVGCIGSEAHHAWGSDLDAINGYEMTGCALSMFANRLSFYFDFKGSLPDPALPMLRDSEYLCDVSLEQSTEGAFTQSVKSCVVHAVFAFHPRCIECGTTRPLLSSLNILFCQYSIYTWYHGAKIGVVPS